MSKKNMNSKPFDIGSLPKQKVDAKYTPKNIINREELETKINVLTENIKPINKQFPKKFWNDYF